MNNRRFTYMKDESPEVSPKLLLTIRQAVLRTLEREKKLTPTQTDLCLEQLEKRQIRTGEQP